MVSIKLNRTRIWVSNSNFSREFKKQPKMSLFSKTNRKVKNNRVLDLISKTKKRGKEVCLWRTIKTILRSWGSLVWIIISNRANTSRKLKAIPQLISKMLFNNSLKINSILRKLLINLNISLIVRSIKLIKMSR